MNEALCYHLTRFENQISRAEKRANPLIASYFQKIRRLLTAIGEAEAAEERRRQRRKRR